jgi:hypothetical protein
MSQVLINFKPLLFGRVSIGLSLSSTLSLWSLLTTHNSRLTTIAAAKRITASVAVVNSVLIVLLLRGTLPPVRDA